MRSKNRKFLLLGGGGHASVVADAMRACDHEVVGFVDDGPLTPTATDRIGAPFLGGTLELQGHLDELEPGVEVFPAVGSNVDRKKLIETLEKNRLPEATAVVHPSACIAESASLGSFVFVGPGVIINAGATIQRGAMINSGTIIEHDCTVGSLSHVAPGAVLCGAATLGELVLVGAGAVVLPGVRIGNGATIGAGGVANKDLPADVVAVGVPARWTTGSAMPSA